MYILQYRQKQKLRCKWHSRRSLADTWWSRESTTGLSEFSLSLCWSAWLFFLRKCLEIKTGTLQLPENTTLKIHIRECESPGLCCHCSSHVCHRNFPNDSKTRSDWELMLMGSLVPADMGKHQCHWCILFFFFCTSLRVSGVHVL